jgi:hypothetical protein
MHLPCKLHQSITTIIVIRLIYIIIIDFDIDAACLHVHGIQLFGAAASHAGILVCMLLLIIIGIYNEKNGNIRILIF